MSVTVGSGSVKKTVLLAEETAQLMQPTPYSNGAEREFQQAEEAVHMRGLAWPSNILVRPFMTHCTLTCAGAG